MGRENRSCNVLLSPIFHVFTFLLFHCCTAADNITHAKPLSQEQVLTSPSQNFELGFFRPDNSANHYVGIWYKDITPRRVVWVANREKPVTDSLSSLTIGTEGNLKLLDQNQDILWSTNVSASSNRTLAVLLDNGNFALTDSVSGQYMWQSFEHPSDTLLVGGSIGFNSKTGERRVLTSWANESDPSPGSFVLGLKPESPPQAFIWKGSLPFWRSGLWDKTMFIGIPGMTSSYLAAVNIIEDKGQGTTYLYTNSYNQSVLITHLFFSSEGYLKTMDGKKGAGWNVVWQMPANPCDFFGTCGPFGVCKASATPICSCLKGFVPKSDEQWSKGNWTEGCVRQANLLCQTNQSGTISNIDGFRKMDRMKLPDFSESIDIDPTQCQQRCLNNCSCIAYAVIYGIGCLVWSGNLLDMQEFSSGGQEFFLRLTLSRQRGREKLIISLTTVSGMIILGILMYGLYRQRSKRTVSKDFQLDDGSDSSEILPGYILRSQLKLEDQSELPMLDLNSILVATDNFSIENKLGQGGFGPVYKGKLRDGKFVAVKRLSSSSGQGLEEFKNEVMLISKLQHRNLVRLFGYCIEKEERILVYEFMANKSLDTFLFDPTKKAELNWARRFNIIQGVARGLLYLHQDSCLRVIHRDLKVGNILLDDKMNPKISDFGLARIFQGTQHLANTHKVVGTLGYMSPEYALGGIFSKKSDVFSFGVLVLEIVNGRKVTASYYADQYMSLISYAWQLWHESKELELIDEALGPDSFSSSEVKRCIQVALLCVQDHADHRPTMSAVVSMLSSETELPKPKQPTFTFQSALNAVEPKSNGICSTNEITESVLVGR